MPVDDVSVAGHEDAARGGVARPARRSGLADFTRIEVGLARLQRTGYPAGKGGKIAKVQQDGTDLVFILAHGTSIDLKTADASSSVVMKGKDGLLAYAG